METPFTVTKICQSALDLKAQKLVKIDLEGKSSLADFVLICHGTSSAHTRGITDKIAQNMKQEGILPLGIEGYEAGEWILMDFNTAIVHIFIEETRNMYCLEEIYQGYSIQSLE